MNQLLRSSASVLAEVIRTGEVSSEEVVGAKPSINDFANIMRQGGL